MEIRRYGGLEEKTAQDLLKKLVRQAEREDLLGEITPSDVTFEAYVPRFLARAKRDQTDTSYTALAGIVNNRLGAFFGRMKLRDIGPREIDFEESC